MTTIFTPTNKYEYSIVRDYYVSNNHLQGIYFVLQDSKGNIITKFLGKELINNKRVWKQKGWIFNKSYQQLRFEKSTSNMLIIEEGMLKFQNGKIKNGERITFNLKHE